MDQSLNTFRAEALAKLDAVMNEMHSLKVAAGRNATKDNEPSIILPSLPFNDLAALSTFNNTLLADNEYMQQTVSSIMMKG